MLRCTHCCWSLPQPTGNFPLLLFQPTKVGTIFNITCPEWNWGCMSPARSPPVSNKIGRTKCKKPHKESSVGLQRKTETSPAPDVPQLEWQTCILGAAFPPVPCDHREVPGTHRGEGPVSGRPRQGRCRHNLLLLSIIKGQEKYPGFS